MVNMDKKVIGRILIKLLDTRATNNYLNIGQNSGLPISTGFGYLETV